MAERDPDDFVVFVRAAGARLYRVAYLLTGDTGRAEDLYQTALGRVFAAWGRIRREDAYAYARVVLVNVHLDWWRRRPWRERLVEAVPERPDRGDPAVDTVERAAMLQALSGLTKRERAVLVLRYYADLTEAETAGSLGVTTGTVKSLTARAFRKLRVSPELARRHDTQATEEVR